MNVARRCSVVVVDSVSDCKKEVVKQVQLCLYLIIFILHFLSRVSILTRDIDIANLSVCLSVRLSVRYVPVPDENGLTYRHSFSPYGSPIILVLPVLLNF